MILTDSQYVLQEIVFTKIGPPFRNERMRPHIVNSETTASILEVFPQERVITYFDLQWS